MADAASVTGIILAGGKSSRMGCDKALVMLRGRPMVAWVMDRLQPQVQSLMLNTNAEVGDYARFSCPVIADLLAGYRGPLAGLHASMEQARTPLLACVPCDAPLLPNDLVARLQAALTSAGADVAVAKTPISLQPTFFVCRNHLGKSIEEYLGEGRYALKHWMARQHCIEVAFDDEAAFSNVNTPDELLQLDRQMTAAIVTGTERSG